MFVVNEGRPRPPNYPLITQILTIKDHGVSIKGPLGGPGRGQGFEQDRISCFGSNRAPAPCNAQAFEVLAVAWYT